MLAGLPEPVRRSQKWDQGTEMCHQHQVTEATGVPVFCQAGMPWQRPSNENPTACSATTSPKAPTSRPSPADLQRVADELNNRPGRTLAWQTPAALFAMLSEQAV